MLKDSSHTKINCHMIAQVPDSAKSALLVWLLELCLRHPVTQQAQEQGLGGKSWPCFQSKPNMSLSVTRLQALYPKFQCFPRHGGTRQFKKIVKLCCWI